MAAIQLDDGTTIEVAHDSGIPWADLAKQRQALGEDVWWYFLYGDRPPFFNPITIDHQGIESRIAYFAAYKQIGRAHV